MKWTLVWLLAGGVLAGTGCARRAERATRAAWQAAQAKPAKHEGTERPALEDPPAPDTVGEGWARVSAMVRFATRELATGEPERLTRLAKRWCAAETAPQETPHGPTVVCFPEPPIQAGGHGFTLEIGGTGIVGLVSTSLSSDESRALVAEARQEGRGWCAEPWQDTASRDTAHGEFHTCAVDGGAVLSVGRLPRDLDADLWQVSVTLFGAT